MDSRRHTTLRATHGDLDRSFVASTARLEKGLEAVFEAAIDHLRRKWSRVPGRNDAERAEEIVAATATAPLLSTPAASHVFSDPKHGPDLASSISSTTSTTRPLSISSGGLATDESHESEVAASSSNLAPAAAAMGISVSSAAAVAPASGGVLSLVVSATTRLTSPGGDMQSEATSVLETPVTCSTLGLYPVSHAIPAAIDIDHDMVAVSHATLTPTTCWTIGHGFNNNGICVREVSAALEGVSHAAPTPTEGMAKPLLPILKIDLLAPVKCSTECPVVGTHTMMPPSRSDGTESATTTTVILQNTQLSSVPPRVQESVWSSAQLDAANKLFDENSQHAAVSALDDSELALATSTMCSTKCPSCDASEELALTSSATLSSSAYVDNVPHELGIDHDIDKGDSLVAFSAPWSVPTLVQVPFASTPAMAATPWAVFALFPINGSVDITKGQAEEMGITSLIRDYLLVNSGLTWDPGTSKFTWYFHEFSVLPSSSATNLSDWLDSDVDKSTISIQSERESDEQCTQLRANPVHGTNHFSHESGQQAPISWFGIGGVSFSDPEKFQWVIAWLYFLVCSTVCSKYHGLASTEARKLNSLLSCGFDLFQWKIAWMLDLESSVVSSGGSGNNSFVLTIARTSHAWLKESSHGSPVDQPTVCKNTTHFPFPVKTYGFHMTDSDQDYYYFACPVLDQVLSATSNTLVAMEELNLRPSSRLQSVPLLPMLEEALGVHWKIAWPLHVSVNTATAKCKLSFSANAAFSDSAHVQWKKAWSLCYACSVVGTGNISRRSIYDYGKIFLPMTWDPGGRACFRLADKPNLMGEGIISDLNVTRKPEDVTRKDDSDLNVAWKPKKVTRKPEPLHYYMDWTMGCSKSLGETTEHELLNGASVSPCSGLGSSRNSRREECQRQGGDPRRQFGSIPSQQRCCYSESRWAQLEPSACEGGVTRETINSRRGRRVCRGLGPGSFGRGLASSSSVPLLACSSSSSFRFLL